MNRGGWAWPTILPAFCYPPAGPAGRTDRCPVSNQIRNPSPCVCIERRAFGQAQPGLLRELFPCSENEPSSTRISAPPERSCSVTYAPGAHCSNRTCSRLSSNNRFTSTLGRSTSGLKGRAFVSRYTWVRSAASNCQSLTKITQPGVELHGVNPLRKWTTE